MMPGQIGSLALVLLVQERLGQQDRQEEPCADRRRAFKGAHNPLHHIQPFTTATYLLVLWLCGVFAGLRVR